MCLEVGVGGGGCGACRCRWSSVCICVFLHRYERGILRPTVCFESTPETHLISSTILAVLMKITAVVSFNTVNSVAMDTADSSRGFVSPRWTASIEAVA